MYKRSSETMLFVHLIYTYIRRMTVFFISVCSMKRGVERVVLFLDSSSALQWREYTIHKGTGNIPGSILYTRGHGIYQGIYYIQGDRGYDESKSLSLCFPNGEFWVSIFTIIINYYIITYIQVILPI